MASSDDIDTVLPEADAVAGFGVPVVLGRKPDDPPLPSSVSGRPGGVPWVSLPEPSDQRGSVLTGPAGGADRKSSNPAIPRGEARKIGYDGRHAEALSPIRSTAGRNG